MDPLFCFSLSSVSSTALGMVMALGLVMADKRFVDENYDIIVVIGQQR